MNPNASSGMGRSLGLKVLLGSLAFGILGASPLLLYIAFGPRDGNPIGLGLLAVTAILVGGLGAACGLVILAIEFLKRPKS